MCDVGLQVPLAEVGPPTRVLPLAALTKGAHEHGAQGARLQPLHFVAAPVTNLVRLLGAIEAEDMLAGDVASVDDDGEAALVAAVDHWVDQLLSDQVHLVVPF